MRVLLITAVCISLLAVAPASARDIVEVPIGFDKGEFRTTITGRIQGYQIIDYQLRANAGDELVIDLKTNHLATYFNLLPPGSDDVALFIGSTSGHHYEARLPGAGLYTIRVYMMRSAARRDEVADYALDVAMPDRHPVMTAKLGSPVVEAGSLAWDRALQGVEFHVMSSGRSSINTLTIMPDGLEIDHAPIVREIDGTVRGVETADLNVDGSPELYVYVVSAGSGSYGSLVAYAANRRKSLSEIYLPPITDDRAASAGYMGHDEFAVVENRLVRRFPVYREQDTNANPTGGMRQLQYRLVAGEAGWLLEVDRIVDY